MLKNVYTEFGETNFNGREIVDVVYDFLVENQSHVDKDITKEKCSKVGIL